MGAFKKISLPLLIVLVLAVFVLGYLARGFFSRPAAPPQALEPSEQAAEPGAEATEAEVWTCSMHPQIRQPKSGQCPICGMDLIPVPSDGAAKSTSLREFRTTEQAKALMNIQTTPVVRRAASKEVRMTGKVDYDEKRLSYISSYIPGRIERLYVDYTGIQVNKGDHMVSIYSPELIQAREELRRAARTVAEVRPGPPDALRNSAQAILAASRQRLERWGLTPEQIRQAEQGGPEADSITIYAPTGGTVIERNGTEGMYVETGTPIYTLADLSTVWVKLDAYESDLPWLRYGQKVEFTAEALPGVTYEGRIAFIEPYLDQATRTIKVRLNVSNRDGKLKPDMFVRSIVRPLLAKGGKIVDPDLAGKWISPMHPEIVKDGPGKCDVCGMDLVPAESLGFVAKADETLEEVLVIPASAALVTGTRAVVYVEVPGAEAPTYEGREILLGPRADSYYVVRSGLQEGERVVTNGNFKIDSALQIMARPSMMSPEAGVMSPDAGGTPGTALSGVAQAYEQVSAAAVSKELARMQQAYRALGQAIGTTAPGGFQGNAALAWKEYSVRLANDSIEGADSQSVKDALRVYAGTRGNYQMLVAQAGAREDHSAHAAAPATAAEPAAPAKADAPPEFQNQLHAILKPYTEMHEALAHDDFNKASAALPKLRQALDKIDMMLLKGDAHTLWMKHLESLNAGIKKIADAKDIGGLRSAFSPLSNELIDAYTVFGVGEGGPIYQLFCPMAFDNKGASWLQLDREVRNPYFGSTMYKCGSVRATIGGTPAAVEPPK
ncbi:MAG TPA: efflux RND transporter periplasmic adaptor subunit [Candidatus Bathyarchaeia archaeon]|nr:efflux RND transporter periplasmic adaptor subunit [Candidatus Bathyarchaeia archaeon]